MKDLYNWLVKVFSGPEMPSKKHPPSPFDSESASLRAIEAEEFRVELDLTSQLLFLDAPPETAWDEEEIKPQPVAPTPAALEEIEGEGRPIVSASMLAQKAKQFDDGLYAAVDLAAQEGCGRFRGKATLFRSFLPRLTGLDPVTEPSAAGILYGAAQLGELKIPTPFELKGVVERDVQAFLDNKLASKPIGFYTWTEELSRIFQQDRMLQQRIMNPKEALAVARTLHEYPGDRATYEDYLNLVARLTNPFPPEYEDLRGLLARLDQGQAGMPGHDLYFFPPSRSHETELVKKLFGNNIIPDGFSLADEIIRQVRAGTLSLTPAYNSGWYDYQTWALEPLIVPDKMPESARLTLGDGYRQQLEELFKGLLVLSRETHIKQLEIPAVGAGLPEFDSKPTIDLRPELSLEPLYSYYLRRAIGYRFIKNLLEETFGVNGLKNMHRLTADGPVAMNLYEELAQISGLFFGAFVVCGRELGLTFSNRWSEIYLQVCRYLEMEPDEMWRLGSGEGPADESEARDAEAFMAWAERGADPDLDRDARMMVPVFYDLFRAKTKVWAFLGWSKQPVTVSFTRRPKVRVLDASGRDASSQVNLEYYSSTYSLAYPVTAELYVDEVMTRKAFQAHCDRYKTYEEIVGSFDL